MLVQNITKSFAILLLLLGTTLSAQEAEGWSPGEYLRQATDNVFEKSSLMNALSEFSFSEELFLAGAVLEVGATIALDIELKEDQAYTFIGGGDEDIADLDLYIVDKDGEIVASDTEDDDTPIPDFTASYTGRFSIRLQLVSGQAASSFVSLSILSTTGQSITEEAFGQISDAFYSKGLSIHQMTTGVKWHDVNNQWCLMAANLSGGQSWDFDNLHLGEGQHYFYAINDKSNNGIDLMLKNRNGKAVGIDRQLNDFPILEIKSSPSEQYFLSVDNKSANRSFIMIGILSE